MLNLELVTDGDTGISTYGRLFLDGKPQCYTLEDSTKNGYGYNCGIPPGTYPVVWAYSPTFKKYTLRIQDVPHRYGILIHAGNTSKDCVGCILLGTIRLTKDRILNSRSAVSSLESKLVSNLVGGKKCQITVKRL